MSAPGYAVSPADVAHLQALIANKEAMKGQVHKFGIMDIFGDLELDKIIGHKKVWVGISKSTHEMHIFRSAKSTTPKRSFSLANATVTEDDGHADRDFTIRDGSTTKFGTFRAPSKQQRTRWVTYVKKGILEATCPTPIQYHPLFFSPSTPPQPPPDPPTPVSNTGSLTIVADDSDDDEKHTSAENFSKLLPEAEDLPGVVVEHDRLADGLAKLSTSALPLWVLDEHPTQTLEEFLLKLPTSQFSQKAIKDMLSQAKTHAKKCSQDKEEELEEEELVALYVYTYHFSGAEYQLYQEMNKAMRKRGEMLKQWHPIIYYVAKAMSILNPSRATVYRGVDLQFNVADFTLGGQIIWPAFSSASRSKETARMFVQKGDASKRGTLFIISGNNCKAIDKYSAYPGEEERLFPPNSKFRIKNFISSSTAELVGQVVELEEIEEVSCVDTIRAPTAITKLTIFDKYLYGCTTSPIVYKWSTVSGQLRARLHHQLPAIRTYCTQSCLFLATEKSHVTLWAQKGDAVKPLIGHEGPVHAIVVWGNSVYTGGTDNKIIRWNEFGEKSKELLGHEDTITHLLPHNDLLYSSCNDTTIKAWNQNGKCVATLIGHSNWVLGLVTYGKALVSYSTDRTLKMWTGNQLTCTCHHMDEVRCVTVWRNRLWSGSCDNTIKKWNQHGHCNAVLQKHTNYVNCLLVWEHLLLSGGRDCCICIWDYDGACLQVLADHTGSVTALIKQKETFFSSSLDATVRKWRYSNRADYRRLLKQGSLYDVSKAHVDDVNEALVPSTKPIGLAAIDHHQHKVSAPKQLAENCPYKELWMELIYTSLPEYHSLIDTAYPDIPKPAEAQEPTKAEISAWLEDSPPTFDSIFYILTIGRADHHTVPPQCLSGLNSLLKGSKPTNQLLLQAATLALARLLKGLKSQRMGRQAIDVMRQLWEKNENSTVRDVAELGMRIIGDDSTRRELDCLKNPKKGIESGDIWEFAPAGIGEDSVPDLTKIHNIVTGTEKRETLFAYLHLMALKDTDSIPTALWWDIVEDMNDASNDRLILQFEFEVINTHKDNLTVRFGDGIQSIKNAAHWQFARNVFRDVREAAKQVLGYYSPQFGSILPFIPGATQAIDTLLTDPQKLRKDLVDVCSANYPDALPWVAMSYQTSWYYFDSQQDKWEWFGAELESHIELAFRDKNKYFGPFQLSGRPSSESYFVNLENEEQFLLVEQNKVVQPQVVAQTTGLVPRNIPNPPRFPDFASAWNDTISAKVEPIPLLAYYCFILDTYTSLDNQFILSKLFSPDRFLRYLTLIYIRLHGVTKYVDIVRDMAVNDLISDVRAAAQWVLSSEQFADSEAIVCLKQERAQLDSVLAEILINEKQCSKALEHLMLH